MASLGELIQSAGPTGFSALSTSIWVLIVMFVIVIVLGIFATIFYLKRRWNLTAIIRVPRSDGKITHLEIGKAHYNSRKAIVFVKRPGRGSKKIPMEIFDPKEYIQGTDTIECILIGPEQLVPVMPNSYETATINSKNGETQRTAIIDLKTDYTKDKQWFWEYQDSSVNAFTIKSILQQFQTPIAIGIVIVSLFIGFSIMWTKLGTVCG